MNDPYVKNAPPEWWVLDQVTLMSCKAAQQKKQPGIQVLLKKHLL